MVVRAKRLWCVANFKDPIVPGLFYPETEFWFCKELDSCREHLRNFWKQGIEILMGVLFIFVQVNDKNYRLCVLRKRC